MFADYWSLMNNSRQTTKIRYACCKCSFYDTEELSSRKIFTFSSMLSSRNFLIQALPFLYSHDLESFAATIAKLTVASSPFLHGSLVPEILKSKDHQIETVTRAKHKLVNFLLRESFTSQFTTRIAIHGICVNCPCFSSRIHQLITGRRYFSRQLLHLHMTDISTNDQKLILKDCLPKLLALRTLTLTCNNTITDDEIRDGLKNVHQLQALSIQLHGREVSNGTFKKILTANSLRYLREFSLLLNCEQLTFLTMSADFNSISDIFPDLEKLSLVFEVILNAPVLWSWENPPDLSVMTQLTDLTMRAIASRNNDEDFTVNPFIRDADCVNRLFRSSESTCCPKLVTLNMSPTCKPAFMQLICYLAGNDCPVKHFNFKKYTWLDDECIELLVSYFPLLEELDLGTMTMSHEEQQQYVPARTIGGSGIGRRVVIRRRGFHVFTGKSMKSVAGHCKNLKRFTTPGGTLCETRTFEQKVNDTFNIDKDSSGHSTKQAFELLGRNRYLAKTLESLTVCSNLFAGVIGWFSSELGRNDVYRLRHLDLSPTTQIKTSLFIKVVTALSDSLETLLGPGRLAENKHHGFLHAYGKMPCMTKLENLTIECGDYFPSSLAATLVKNSLRLKKLTIIKSKIFSSNETEFFTPVAQNLKGTVDVRIIASFNNEPLPQVEACFGPKDSIRIVQVHNDI